MKRIIGKRRLTRAELEDIRDNSGITELEFNIIKRKYYDKDAPYAFQIVDELHISPSQYTRTLNRAIEQITAYWAKNGTP